MKQVVIISGKGGTGKTVLTAAFASLAKNAVFADCDVDAADLHLLLHPRILERQEFIGSQTAVIDKKLCKGCKKCIYACRFGAIGEDLVVDPIACEGCGFCKFVCPYGAIRMEENTTGEWFVSETRFGPLFHAKLGVAEENSGDLVSLVKKKAKERAKEEGYDWVIIDGAPGIGCPVIASLADVDFALVVAEPTLSGLHDAARVIGVAKHFGVFAKLVINKYDLNLEMSRKIEEYCRQSKVPLIGKIRFDKTVVEAMMEGQTIIEYCKDTVVKKEIVNVWRELSAVYEDG